VDPVTVPGTRAYDGTGARLAAHGAPVEIPEHLFIAIDHVGIAVPDLDEAIAFYAETFGMQVVHEETNEEQGVREAMVAVGDSGSCIQLLAPSPSRRSPSSSTVRPGPAAARLPGHRHRRGLRDPARARPAPALRRAQARHGGLSRVNFVHPKDAGGVLVELVEPNPDAHH
jgi:methylmalonyl-CoA/ethylmalonyl-CoA epimerase